ncbi:hypothetical protein CDL12_24095 [Handroanthus impetiginosus]|uniref:BHLH domain-containing protein n=1 Tax=Handroanthus impetiginosus TaxID=429701 RepID=A0A2G9GDK7_9LAMI|nr:hypothetical protein CDL12_24095 [Handroanthus impetiginosus]
MVFFSFSFLKIKLCFHKSSPLHKYNYKIHFLKTPSTSPVLSLFLPFKKLSTFGVSVCVMCVEWKNIHADRYPETWNRIKAAEKMMQHKRSLISVDQSSVVNLMPKRVKNDVSLSSKEKKEQISQRISALQQLVSPYGKTDTASVLLEAMEYINFLHDQVKVLSAPYLYCTPTQTQGEEPCSLKAKGLCLVPISFTEGVVSSNGADIWAPIKTSPQCSRRSILDEASVITHG